jgi:hypothetical protein
MLVVAFTQDSAVPDVLKRTLTGRAHLRVCTSPVRLLMLVRRLRPRAILVDLRAAGGVRSVDLVRRLRATDEDEQGNLLIREPWVLGLTQGSWVTFECKVWKDNRGKYTGRILKTTGWHFELYDPDKP